MRRLVRVAVIVVLALASPLLGPVPTAASDAYTITDLGTLGGVGSSAVGVNEAGDVAGTSNTASGEPNAYRWRNGVMTGIHAMGGYGSYGFGISDDGWVVGLAGTSSGHSEAMYWSGADPHPIGRLGNQWSEALAINDAHQIVGRSPNADGQVEAFSWQDGVITGIGSLVEGGYSEASDINDAGVIVGEAGAPGSEIHAFRYADGVMTDLGVPTPNFAGTRAYGINEAGVIVGGAQVTIRDRLQPFILADGEWQLIGGVHGYADAVNAAGVVVGAYDTPTGESGFVYRDGVLTDLNQLIPAGSGWQLHRAFDINDSGQIVGQGTRNGQNRGFLLTPKTASADLSLSGSADAERVKAGQTVQFTFTVANAGPDAADSVQLTDQLPPGLSFVSASTSAGTCVSGPPVRCSIGTVAAHATATVTITARVTAGGGTTVVNTAVVESTTQDPATGNESASATVQTRGKPSR